jgi:hypothetical protein
MSTFEEYVDGKTIAIVGPAPAPYDQSAEVDAHDIVYRTSYGFQVPTDPSVLHSSSAAHGTDWFRSGVFPAGYGTRVDMAFYNNEASGQAMRGELDHVLVDLDWAMFKTGGPTDSPLTRGRPVHRAPVKVPGTESQVTAMLWDLTHYRPAAVTVFGADFYTGQFEDWYSTEYVPLEHMTNRETWQASISAIHWHDQDDQRRIVRMVRSCGWLVGDARYLRALDMTREESNGILEAQLTRANQAATV